MVLPCFVMFSANRSGRTSASKSGATGDKHRAAEEKKGARKEPADLTAQGKPPGTGAVRARWPYMARPPPKKPPARSVTTRAPAGPDVKGQIIGELYVALERLGADEDLLAIVGSWGDTLDDEEVLLLLREHNATGKAL
jgi:hypothetical protein